PRRQRLHQRVSDRPVVARREALRNRRGHVGDPADADRPRAVQRDEMNSNPVSDAGPPQGARPPSGGGREATSGGSYPIGGLVDTYRGAVYPWHCDHMGHMNVMWHIGKFDEATWTYFSLLGLTPTFLRDNARGMAAVEQRIAYQRELVAGDVVAVR